ncbi:PD-(D/E)XK motif protein [Clavibacter michiganensis subsp. michiganensis]|nr:PD-(D/E)XK motif protein [Clavibacter michiganensis subsp. michiganensis]MWJ88657.1 PD-(D/E)XK motif protein [Clavibacter michiganensis subsp. michiganensis]OQJ67397.1 hypothetical protein B5P23_08530 [Clavibacter michiganensis subsp. michiganensis]QGV76693.1 PD-(D/E)XK motif protein [Clavibacter michiganensis subsp. michiganensis]RMC86560.1 PD-(D/E)XK motif protein [Clavibacter michiganensis subsp. michiganensis]
MSSSLRVMKRARNLVAPLSMELSIKSAIAVARECPAPIALRIDGSGESSTTCGAPACSSVDSMPGTLQPSSDTQRPGSLGSSTGVLPKMGGAGAPLDPARLGGCAARCPRCSSGASARRSSTADEQGGSMVGGLTEKVVQHLTPETVDVYFRAAAPARFRLSAKIDAFLDIDPHAQQISLYVPTRGEVPDVSAFERISVAATVLPGRSGKWFRIDIDAAGMRYEAYTLAESVVDQMQHGATLRHALCETLEALKDLLSRRRRLTDEKEAGFLGELLLLRHVIDVIGEDAAVGAWLGPESGEHDFGFDDFEAEVKTTRSDSRLHVIGSETQLMPSPGRPLYLVSIQLTLAGRGQDGFTLPQLVDEVRSSIGHSSRTLDDRLESAGWRDEARDLYALRFQYRSRPRAFLVDERFPAITRPRLDAVVPQPVHVGDVSYRLNVTDFPFTDAPAPLNGFCEGEA